MSEQNIEKINTAPSAESSSEEMNRKEILEKEMAERVTNTFKEKEEKVMDRSGLSGVYKILQG
jgi:hypothetical protein